MPTESKPAVHTPWIFGESAGGNWYVYVEGERAPMKPQIKVSKRGTKEQFARARLIVRSVNSHAALVSILKHAVKAGYLPEMSRIEAERALALAEER